MDNKIYLFFAKDYAEFEGYKGTIENLNIDTKNNETIEKQACVNATAKRFSGANSSYHKETISYKCPYPTHSIYVINNASILKAYKIDKSLKSDDDKLKKTIEKDLNKIKNIIEALGYVKFDKVNVLMHLGIQGNKSFTQKFEFEIRTCYERHIKGSIPNFDLWCISTTRDHIFNPSTLPDEINEVPLIIERLEKEAKVFEQTIELLHYLPSLRTLDILLQGWLMVNVWAKENSPEGEKFKSILAEDAGEKLKPFFRSDGENDYWLKPFEDSLDSINLEDFKNKLNSEKNKFHNICWFLDSKSRKEEINDDMLPKYINEAHKEICKFLLEQKKN